MPVDKTQRGFAIFGEFTTDRQSFRVQESSLALEGPHVWVFCNNRIDGQQSTSHVDVEGAKQMIAALQAFVESAETGELTEEYS